MEELINVLWRRYGRNGKWGDLAAALEQRLLAKKMYLEDLKKRR
jgi:hypothetical protein